MEEFIENVETEKDLELFRIVDDLLWFDWDPIGVNSFAPRDEYERYVPEIFRLVKAKVDREVIANQLFKFETEDMGMEGKMENCWIVADKLIAIQF